MAQTSRSSPAIGGAVPTQCDGVLLIAGGVGETYMLEDDEFRRLADLLVEEVDGRVPTMVMVHELGVRRAAGKVKYAADAGIDFVLLSPPHYSLPTEDDIFLHKKYVNDAADIGIVLYNSYWVMPNPGYEFTPGLLKRLAELDNIVGIKWSASSVPAWIGMQKRFGDRFVFIQNMFVFGEGPRYGMNGFIDLFGNAAPRFSLHMWDLMKRGKYAEYAEAHRKYQFDPALLPGTPEESFSGVGDGQHAMMILKLLGLDAGPAFPGQAGPPQAHIDYQRRIIEASGMLDWVDWDQSIFD